MAGMVSIVINLLREGVHTQTYTMSLALQLLLPPTTKTEVGRERDIKSSANFLPRESISLEDSFFFLPLLPAKCLPPVRHGLAPPDDDDDDATEEDSDVDMVGKRSGKSCRR